MINGPLANDNELAKIYKYRSEKNKVMKTHINGFIYVGQFEMCNHFLRDFKTANQLHYEQYDGNTNVLDHSKISNLMYLKKVS